MDPRVQGRSHPQLDFQIVREAHATLLISVGQPSTKKRRRWRFVRFARNIMISTIKEQDDEQRHGP
jgi:hypothetical protein